MITVKNAVSVISSIAALIFFYFLGTQVWGSVAAKYGEDGVATGIIVLIAVYVLWSRGAVARAKSKA